MTTGRHDGIDGGRLRADFDKVMAVLERAASVDKALAVTKDEYHKQTEK